MSDIWKFGRMYEQGSKNKNKSVVSPAVAKLMILVVLLAGPGDSLDDRRKWEL